jgi:hypothetical protein
MRTSSSKDIQTQFFENLTSEWRFSCQNGTGEKYFCVDTTALGQWMASPCDRSSKKNGVQLVDSISNIFLPRTWGSDPEQLLFGNHSHVLVLSCLFALRHERFIYAFQQFRIDDQALRSGDLYDRYQRLMSRLIEKGEPEGVIQTVIDEFEVKKWSFLPAHLDFDLKFDMHFVKGTILPYCERQKVNDKGGTASVDQILVPNAFVSEEWKRHLGQPFTHSQHGKVRNSLQQTRAEAYILL